MEITGENITRQSPAVLAAKQRFGIVGNAPVLVAAVERALRVAPIDLSVLVTGESGSGKEFFPQIIHANSPRKHAKYIAVNCGAIPEGTIDSELFGHEKGSFTGAVASRKGYFEEADGGTIFLDEVAELPLTTQARLLRVLETGEFLKVGSSTVQKTNIRVVAATNVDMVRAVEEGRFREDLYYRLSTVQIPIPPLRDRGSDIGLLTRKFAAGFAEKWHLPQVTFSDEARITMNTYRWPGNVRQLKNIVEQIALFEAGGEITRSVLEKYLPANATVMAPAVRGTTEPADRSAAYSQEREMLLGLILRLQKRVDDLERRMGNEQPTSQHLSPSNLIGKASEAVREESQDIASLPLRRFKEFKEIEGNDKEAHEIIDMPYETYTAEPERTSPEHPATLEEQEVRAIRQALTRHNGRRQAAAEDLGISQRTLYRKIKEYGLE